MGISSHQQEAAEFLQVGMLRDPLHQPMRQTPATVFFKDVDVGQVGKGGFVGNDSSKRDLLSINLDAEAKGILGGLPDNLKRNLGRPLRPRQIRMDGNQIHVLRALNNLIR